MKNYITKVVYNDDSEDLLQIFDPIFLEIDGENAWDRTRRKRAHQIQFKDFQETILKNLIPDFVKEYASYEFDLITKDDCDCSDEEKELSDFDDSEIYKELQKRGLFTNINFNVISADFIQRFTKIIERENAVVLDSVLSEFETKLCI